MAEDESGKPSTHVIKSSASSRRRIRYILPQVLLILIESGSVLRPVYRSHSYMQRLLRYSPTSVGFIVFSVFKCCLLLYIARHIVYLFLHVGVVVSAGRLIHLTSNTAEHTYPERKILK